MTWIGSGMYVQPLLEDEEGCDVIKFPVSGLYSEEVAGFRWMSGVERRGENYNNHDWKK